MAAAAGKFDLTVFLESVGAEHYTQKLLHHGVDTLEELATLTLDKLEEWNIYSEYSLPRAITKAQRLVRIPLIIRGIPKQNVLNTWASSLLVVPMYQNQMNNCLSLTHVQCWHPCITHCGSGVACTWQCEKTTPCDDIHTLAGVVATTPQL